ncbi:NAD-dependent succinate-semialdehyde dehydrogenase [Qipengyuania nanhaisediminis]|uniref:Succinate-semialdehyde dehydrogenase / glutarate-semialdehyde dehydrogenase n=1 Tax=Qipengyuania nanhaisediminis TaxID=604088 RepID=A0A1I5L4Q2_9SPHN|nr:NAD-dependent succinate-semialdehyde dehydrogenase [Qipengyuania nanhaisediminis]SFO92300.1 succinate-semialdehyde dehydrogenase / glutarate-semialdehyde dehydrogenase [Qipengyuania nanhaisediminis]
MITTTNPATGETIATYETLDDNGIDAKLEAATRTYREWRTSPIEQRVELLSALGDLYESNKEELARLAVTEMGKPITQARGEVEKCASLFHYFAEAGPPMLESEFWELSDGGRAEGRWLPQGPVLAVMPWNFPFWQVVRFLAPTILAGNVGVLKHASIVQGVAHRMEELVLEAGGPEGLFQNLCVSSDPIGDVIADTRIVAATLTGSEGAGSAVAQQAGKHLKKVVLELGGSDPFVVMPSADLDQAVEDAVFARIQNNGQSCICGKRTIVHADIHDAFAEKFIAALKDVKLGDPMDDDTELGPLSSEGQRDTVLDQVATAKDEGCTLLFGGEKLDSEGAWMTAGLLTDVPLASETGTDEIFGPVGQIYKAKGIEEAITIANAIPFGLGSAVWTNDDEEREIFANRIEAGMTTFNAVNGSKIEAPFGGIKKSGFGRELSHHGLHEFMNLKTLVYPAEG